MSEQEWFTIRELAVQWGISYSKLRAEVTTLINIDAIRHRDRPGDNRMHEIHKDSLALVKRAAGMGEE